MQWSQLETAVGGVHSANEREAGQGNRTPPLSSLEQHLGQETAWDKRTQCRVKESISNNSCCSASFS